MIFSSLIKGIQHFEYCQVCGNELFIINDTISNSVSTKELLLNQAECNLIYSLDEQDKLILNIKSQSISIEYCKNLHTSKYKLPPQYNYVDCFMLPIFCKNCDNFNYELEITIDTFYKEINCIRLSNVSYTVSHNNKIYDLYEDYLVSKTSLILNSKILLTVPLLGICQENLKYTFGRLQKLVILS